MVIFEDLHWIDEATQEFLNLLADSIGTAKILLLVNYRPEYSHQWSSKTYYTQLRLDPLGKESADEMLTALLGLGSPCRAGRRRRESPLARLSRVLTRERASAARSRARVRVPICIAQAADYREDRGQSVLHGRDGAGAVRGWRAGSATEW